MQGDGRKALPPRKRWKCGQQRIELRRHSQSGPFPITISKIIPAALSESCGQTNFFHESIRFRGLSSASFSLRVSIYDPTL
jgi:hypothetical protein